MLKDNEEQMKREAGEQVLCDLAWCGKAVFTAGKAVPLFRSNLESIMWGKAPEEVKLFYIVLALFLNALYKLRSWSKQEGTLTTTGFPDGKVVTLSSVASSCT